MVADTHHIERVILKLVLDEFEEFPVVFEFSIDTLKPVGFNRIGERHGNFQLDSFVFVILIRVEPGIQTLIQSKADSPENNIIPAHIKEENNKQDDGKDLFQGSGLSQRYYNFSY